MAKNVVCTELSSVLSLTFNLQRQSAVKCSSVSESQGNGWKKYPDLGTDLQKGETRVKGWDWG